MHIIRDFSSCPSKHKGAVIALGNFDGVHLGHKEILRHAIAIARAEGVPAAVMTFEPHPREFFARQKQQLPPALRICSFHRKIGLIREAGIDTLFIVRFNRRFASLSPEDFIRDVLVGQLAVKHVVTGYNFAFGKDRGGSTDFLHQQARALGFGFTACPPVIDSDAKPISSSAIRQLLASGDMQKAARLLGHPYIIDGRVRYGHQRGRTIGFPTANIHMGKLFHPRYGVYAVKMELQYGKIVDGVANIGLKPTFNGSQVLLEAHGFGVDEHLYGQYMKVQCIEFIRDEQKFDSIDLLKAQITADSHKAKGMLAHATH